LINQLTHRFQRSIQHRSLVHQLHMSASRVLVTASRYSRAPQPTCVHKDPGDWARRFAVAPARRLEVAPLRVGCCV
ncbi:MAG TPA: hypothetical protein VIJ30_01440, partial [Candidatus Dormibacteraeota bacterium]